MASTEAAHPFGPCPVEIIRKILGYLQAGDLQECCLTNSYFCAVAESVLYSQVDIKWTNPEDMRLGAFVRTILDRPELARHVRRLSLRGCNFQTYGSLSQKLWPRKLNLGSHADGFVAFVDRLGVPFRDTWHRGLRDGSVDALVALLISQLPNLVTLLIGPNFDGDYHLIGLLLRWSLFQTPDTDQRLSHFKQLQDVSLGLGYDRQVYRSAHRDEIKPNTADLLPLFYLPQIRRFAASLDDSPLASQWPLPAPTPKSITALELDFIREHHLGSILSVTTGLQSLRWVCHPAVAMRDDFTTLPVDLDQVVAAVSHVRDTLTDLSLRIDLSLLGGLLEAPWFRPQGSLKGLVDLDNVKNFTAPFVLLMGGLGPDPNAPAYPPWDSMEVVTPSTRLRDGIPRNVEHVTITDDLSLHEHWRWTLSWTVEPYLFALRAWLSEWRECNPRLRRVTLVHETVGEYFVGGEEEILQGQELRDMFARAGVELEVVEVVEDFS